MCKQGETKEIITLDGKSISVDACLQPFIQSLNNQGYKTVGCCCGHGKYPSTIIHKTKHGVFEWYSNLQIPRKKKFYIKDSDGIYYIPEVSDK